MRTPSEKIIQMWKEEKWEYEEYENGFCFKITFPFMQFDRNITIFFENDEGKNYYYIKTQVFSKDKSSSVYEYLYIEPKEHMMIHKTLLDLDWLKEEQKKEENKELTLFDFNDN